MPTEKGRFSSSGVFIKFRVARFGLGHPAAFGCHRGVDPKVGFRVNFICESLNERFKILPDMQHPCVHISTAVSQY